MDLVICDNIGLRVDMEELYRKLSVKGESPITKRAEELAAEAEKIAKPKGLYRLSYIEDRGEDSITIKGERFISKVLRVNVDKLQRVFLFLATCGKELEEWAKEYDDMLDTYIVDIIMQIACTQAEEEVCKHIEEKYNLENTSKMHPGSLGDWPIEEQDKLFKILNNSNNLIGVELTESYLMKPTKTVSGIRFASDVKFHDCLLCPNEACPNRRVPFAKELYETRYGL